MPARAPLRTRIAPAHRREASEAASEGGYAQAFFFNENSYLAGWSVGVRTTIGLAGVRSTIGLAGVRSTLAWRVCGVSYKLSCSIHNNKYNNNIYIHTQIFVYTHKYTYMHTDIRIYTQDQIKAA